MGHDKAQRLDSKSSGETAGPERPDAEPDDLDVEPAEAAKVHGGIVGPCNMPGPESRRS